MRVMEETASLPQPIPERSPLKLRPVPSSSVTIPTSSSPQPARNGHLALDTFSPVNQNGSFEFDRVIRTGEVQKRTRKTKTWRTVHLVLRPNLLSIYKKPGEVKLQQQVSLSDLTAIAYLKDPKRDFVFGLYSPSKNYHLQGKSQKDAEQWVNLIRREARIDEEEEGMFLASHTGHKDPYHGYDQRHPPTPSHVEHERLASSSPEPIEHARPVKHREGPKALPMQRQSSLTLDYSGNEHGSVSDFSDGPAFTGNNESAFSVSQVQAQARPASAELVTGQQPQPSRENVRNFSNTSRAGSSLEDERVVWHGQLLCLAAKGGVRRWKSVWAVLRARQLALYKSKEEYSAILVLPLISVINAVEIDPISRSKSNCMQIITPNKSYRFCAPGEEALDKWLGALKSLLAKRKEIEKKRFADNPATAAGQSTTAT